MWFCSIKFETGLKPVLGLSPMIHIECIFGEYQTGVVVNILKCIKWVQLKHFYSDWFFVSHSPN